MRLYLTLILGLALASGSVFAGQSAFSIANNSGSAPAALTKDIRTPGAACSNLSAKAWSSTGAMLICENGLTGRVWGFVAQDSRDSAMAGYPELPTAMVLNDGYTTQLKVTARFVNVTGNYAYYDAFAHCENSSESKVTCVCTARLNRSSGAISVSSGQRSSCTSSSSTLNGLIAQGLAW